MSGAKAGMNGGSVSVLITKPENPEKHKYEQIWELDAYRRFSPGAGQARVFLELAEPEPGDEVLVFGCGMGLEGQAIGNISKELYGEPCKVTMFDFAANCLNDEIREACETEEWLNFKLHDIEEPVSARAPFGFCCDVMEHIPEDKVAQVIENIVSATGRAYFCIANHHESYGNIIGETLHVTVKPFTWWEELFESLGCMILASARVNEDAPYPPKEGQEAASIFYVSKWIAGKEIRKVGKLNTEEEIVRAQIKKNLETEYQQVGYARLQPDAECMILCGGPSLNDFEKDIREKREAGMPLITINGTYGWALERGLTPSALVMVDSRALNARFVTEIVPNCRYMLSSQVHPDVYAKIPKEQIVQWHSSSAFLNDIYEEHFGENWLSISGGSTATLRALVLFRVLGWKNFHMYGFDSCICEQDANYSSIESIHTKLAEVEADKEGLSPGVADRVRKKYISVPSYALEAKHHAYEQPENDEYKVYTVKCGNRIFYAQNWMCAQAQEFIEQMDHIGKEYNLAVYGDGLIKAILESAAGSDIDLEVI